jgi:putative membrane protein
MSEPASPRPGAARTLPPPSANGSSPPPPPRPPPAAAEVRHSVLRTRISGMRTALIAGVLVLIVLVIFIVQNARAVKLSFLGAHLQLSLAAALLLAAIAGALLMAAAGTARISQLRRALRRTRRRDPPPAPATPGQ